jgi:hypothetical protein
VDDEHVGGVLTDLGACAPPPRGNSPARVLAGGLREELLDPVPQTRDAGRLVDQDDLVPQRGGPAQGGAEHQRRVALAVVGQQVGHHRSRVQQARQVGAGESGRHEPERRERREPAADLRVGPEDGSVAGVHGEAFQGGSGIGDHDDPVGWGEAGSGEGGVERAPVAVGLDRRSGLAGDHDDGPLQVAGKGGPHLVGVGAVEHHQRHACGAGDHLGGERGAAHPAQDHPVDPFGGQLGAQPLDLGDQGKGAFR